MSRLIARILLTILLFPSAVLVLIISAVLLEDSRVLDDEGAIIFCSLLTCAYMIAYWLLLWRHSVVWTPDRLRATGWSVAAALLVALLVGGVIAAAISYERWIGLVLGALAGTIFWLIGTIFVWRETPAERSARLTRAGADALVCPTCGYNLTGLREARCPECGASFTLNELLAAQPGRADVEVDQV